MAAKLASVRTKRAILPAEIRDGWTPDGDRDSSHGDDAPTRRVGESTQPREGGTFRLGISGLISIDPALASITALPLLKATCAGLMVHPDQPLPAGLRLVPEVAADYPVVSGNGRTYTFTIRSGFRFSTASR
jgi:ABC-type transport system substrate-binding protein